MSEVRIALEGQLEKVEVAGELLRRVQALLRSRRADREDLAQVPVGTPIAPFLLAAGLFLALSVVHGTKRVVVSATRLRLGARSWALNDISRFVVEGPSLVVATIETHAGTTCEVLLPGAIDPLIVALRSGGVAVSVQFRSEASS